MNQADALQHLRDALGSDYEGPMDDPSLLRALAVDGRGAFRPWSTAARLIKFNTTYEVGGELHARIDRKLTGLRTTQADADRAAGVAPAGIIWGDRL